MGCVFCSILEGSIPSTKVYEDEHTVAIMDINPLNDGHLLVLSRAHRKDIHEIADVELAAVMSTVKKMAAAVQRGLGPGGINLLQANGPAAFQSVPHFHVHVIPRWDDDGKGLDWELVRGDPGRIAAAAERIRAALAGA